MLRHAERSCPFLPIMQHLSYLTGLKANVHLLFCHCLTVITSTLLFIVPPNCTDRLQPLDISVNKAVKEHLRKQFNNWYSSQVSKQINNGAKLQPIDLSMSVVKPLGSYMDDEYI